MTQPGYTTVQTQALQENADRLGLMWKKRPATIVAPQSDDPTGVTAIMDGDTVAINVYSLIGVPAVGARVMCDIVPPSGIYITGYVGRTPGSILAGKRFVTGGTKISGVGAGEAAVPTYTFDVQLPANRLVRLFCSFRVQTTNNNETFLFRIRESTLTGAVVGFLTETIPSSSPSYHRQFEIYVTSSSPVAKTYILTAQSIIGVGTIAVFVDANSPNAFLAFDEGDIARTTSV